MFDFLEELAAFYGYITDEQYLKCKNCGFLMENQKSTKPIQMTECQKCGEKKREETSLLKDAL